MRVASKLLVRMFVLGVLVCPLSAKADSAAYKALQKQSNILFKAGDFNGSLALSHKLLALAKSEFGPDHTQTAMAHFGIGFNLLKLNRGAEAIPHYEKHLAINEKIYDVKAMGLQFPLNHLAGLYKKLGKLDKAEALYARVRTIQEALTGGTTRFSARAHGNIAAVNLQQFWMMGC